VPIEQQLTPIRRPNTIVALVIILLPAIAIWQWVRFSGFTPDDYMIIDVQSPIASFIDAISMFWRNDPNPQYWRPLTNSSVSIDFWLWGWNGAMFHITNLILHLIATSLVYFFLLRIFRLQQRIAMIVALFFGIAACHDANMLWIAARSDVIATITMLGTLLAGFKAMISKSNRIAWLLISYFCFLMGLCSKEVSAVVIVLLPLLVWTNTPRELWHERKSILKNLAPYFFIAVAFLFLRLQFTVPLDEMQPMVAEGSRSPIAFAKNVLYSIGYILAPLDFQTASTIINHYLTIGFIVAAVMFAAIALTFWKMDKGEAVRHIYKPVVLTVITGLVAFQSFERWRVYLPSVGVFTILALLLLTLWKSKTARIIFRIFTVTFVVLLFGFNVYQTITKQQVWAEATSLIDGYKNDLKGILANHPERPITLNLITNPIKLGDAQLIQLSTAFLPIAAEAERRNDPLLAVGSLGDAKDEVDHISNLDIYALDPDSAFNGLLIKGSGSVLHIGMTPDARLAFAPNIPITDGVAKRDRVYTPGSTYNTDGAIITVRTAEKAFIKEADILVNDTAGVPIYFDGTHIRELR
jgi:hypothetical protein